MSELLRLLTHFVQQHNPTRTTRTGNTLLSCQDLREVGGYIHSRETARFRIQGNAARPLLLFLLELAVIIIIIIVFYECFDYLIMMMIMFTIIAIIITIIVMIIAAVVASDH